MRGHSSAPQMAARQVETMFMDFLERQERRMVAEDAAIFRVNNFDIIVNTLR